MLWNRQHNYGKVNQYTVHLSVSCYILETPRLSLVRGGDEISEKKIRGNNIINSSRLPYKDHRSPKNKKIRGPRGSIAPCTFRYDM